jgi:hypothetical protein
MTTITTSRITPITGEIPLFESLSCATETTPGLAVNYTATSIYVLDEKCGFNVDGRCSPISIHNIQHYRESHFGRASVGITTGTTHI